MKRWFERRWKYANMQMFMIALTVPYWDRRNQRAINDN